MSEHSPKSDPDIDYAKKLRIVGISPDGSNKPLAKYTLDPSKIKDSDELSDSTRSQLDFIISTTHDLAEGSADIAGLSEQVRADLQSGHVMAGLNESGVKDATEVRMRSLEEFRAMVARAVGERALAAYESELEALNQPAKTDTTVSEEPTNELAESESEVTLTDVLSSPESMIEALHDSELNPDLKRQLYQMVDIWNTAKLSQASERIWSDIIKPQLSELDVPLENMSRDVDRASSELSGVLAGLRQLADAIEYGDHGHAADLRSRYNFNDSLDSILRSLDTVLNDNNIANQALKLGADIDESDSGLRHMHRSSGVDDFLVDDARDLLDSIDVGDGIGATNIYQQIEEQAAAGSTDKLSRHKDAVEAVVRFARLAGNDKLAQNYESVRRVIMDQVEYLFNPSNRVGAAEIHQFRGYIERELVEPLQDIERFARLASAHQKETT